MRNDDFTPGLLGVIGILAVGVFALSACQYPTSASSGQAEAQRESSANAAPIGYTRRCNVYEMTTPEGQKLYVAEGRYSQQACAATLDTN